MLHKTQKTSTVGAEWVWGGVVSDGVLNAERSEGCIAMLSRRRVVAHSINECRFRCTIMSCTLFIVLSSKLVSVAFV